MYIRNIQESDMEQLHALIKEHAEELNMGQEVVLSLEDLIEHGLRSSPPSFEGQIAYYQTNEEIVMIGYVIYYDAYSTWEGKTMMVEDMFIKPQHRDDMEIKGLLNLILKFAHRNDYNRLEFNVYENDPLTYYHLSKGALNLADSDVKVNYKFDDKEHQEPERWLSYRIPKDVMLKLARNL